MFPAGSPAESGRSTPCGIGLVATRSAIGETFGQPKIAALARRSCQAGRCAARLYRGAARHHLPIVAAGLSFYGLLAMFPALLVIVSIYGLAGDPREVERHLAAAQGFLPDEVIQLLGREMHTLIAHPVRRLSLGLAFGLLVTVTSAATAGGALMSSLNIVFRTRETRGFVRRQATALALTAGLVSFVVALLGFLALTPPVLRHLGFRPAAAAAVALARWPLAALMVGAALAAIYRLGPNHRRRAGWMVGWATPAATAAWLAATAGFSLYVAKFHTFDHAYGSIGAAVALLVWLYLTALIVLLGGELHAARRRDVMRRQPARPASE